MLHRLAIIALAQVKAGNTCENLLNEIRKLIYYLYWAKKSLASKSMLQYNESNKDIIQKQILHLWILKNIWPS